MVELKKNGVGSTIVFFCYMDSKIISFTQRNYLVGKIWLIEPKIWFTQPNILVTFDKFKFFY